MISNLKCYLFLTIFLLLSVFINAQSVWTSVDKKSILIGEQFQYQVEVSFPVNHYSIRWFNLPDSFSHFEVIERGKIDTTTSEGTIRQKQVITLTSFDSGLNVLPSFTINLDPIGSQAAGHLQTDSISMNVLYSPLDSTKTFHDIKTILEVKDQWPLWKWFLAGLLLLLFLAVIIFLIRFFKRKNSKNVFSSRLSPFDEAMKLLQQLWDDKLLEKDGLKEFHTRIFDIFRRYISRKTNNNLLNQTSSEMLLLLQDHKVTRETVSTSANVLKMGEAVKFAKYHPSLSENEEAFQYIKLVIKQINDEQSNTATGK